MVCGIYGIRHSSGKMYIGKSTNIAKRFIRHRCLLKAHKHYNCHLQRAWDKYGSIDFEFLILEECSSDELTHKEQNWVDGTSSKYNHILDVIKNSGPTNPFFGKKHNNETKIKMSKAKENKYVGHNNPNFGRKHSVDSKIKMAEGISKKLTKEIVLVIKELLKRNEMSHQQIADRFNVSRTVVTRIASGSRWASVTDGAMSREHVGNKKGKTLGKQHRERIGKAHKNMKYKKAKKENV